MAGLHYDTGGVPSEKLALADAATLAAEGKIELMTMVWTDDPEADMAQWLPLRECTKQFPEVVARAKEYAAQGAQAAQAEAGPGEAGAWSSLEVASDEVEEPGEAADADGSGLAADNEYTIEHADTGMFVEQTPDGADVCCVPAAARSKAGVWVLEATEEGYFGLRNGQSGAFLDVLDGAAVQYGACTIHVRGIPKEYESDDALRSVFAEYGQFLQSTVRQRSDTVVDGRVVAALSWALVTFSDQAAVDRVLATKLLTAGGKILGVARVDAEKAMTSTGSFGQTWRDGRHKAEAEIDRLYGGGDGEHEARGLSDEALVQWRSADSQIRVGSKDGSQAGAHWAFEASSRGVSIWNRKAAQCLCTAEGVGGLVLTLEADSSESSTKFVLRRPPVAPPMELPDLQVAADMSPRTSSAIDAAIAAAMGEVTAESVLAIDAGAIDIDDSVPASVAARMETQDTAQASEMALAAVEAPPDIRLQPEVPAAEVNGPRVFTIEHADTGLFLEKASDGVGVCCVPAAARSKAGVWMLEAMDEEGYFGLRNGQSGAFLDMLDSAAVQYGACTIHVRGIPKEYESDDALRSVFAEYGQFLQSTVRQRSDTVVDGRVVAALSWALVTFSDQAAVDRVLSTKVLAGNSMLGVARVDAEKAMTSTGAFGQIWREGKRKVEAEIDRLYGGGDGEHEARGLSDEALVQWRSADSQIRVGSKDGSQAGAHWAFEPEFRGHADADGLSLWNRKAALCLSMGEDTWKDGKMATRLSADSTESEAKWNLRRASQTSDGAGIEAGATPAGLRSPAPTELLEDELTELDTERLRVREEEMKAALLELQRTGSSEAAANVEQHYRRMMQLAAHHGQRAEEIDNSRERIARDALQVKRQATQQAELLARQVKSEQEKAQKLAEAFDASWTQFIVNQKELSSKRLRDRRQRRDLKEIMDAWRHLAVESLLEDHANAVERAHAEAEHKVAEMHVEHQQVMMATKRSNSQTLTQLEQQKLQLEEEHERKVLSAKEETQLAREMLARVQAAKALDVEEQAKIRTRALENRVQSEIERLSKQQMAEYASIHRAASERQSHSYEMRSSSYPVDLSSIGGESSATTSTRRSPSPRRASPRAGSTRAHSEHLLLSKREGRPHAEYLAGLEERLKDEEDADAQDHRCHHKTLKGRRDDLKTFLEDAKAIHVGQKPRPRKPKRLSPRPGEQQRPVAAVGQNTGTTRVRRKPAQPLGGALDAVSCCASTPKIREGVPPATGQEMELTHDTVKPPPTWSCGSRPAARTPKGRPPPSTTEPARGAKTAGQQRPSRNRMADASPPQRRRGGGAGGFGLCGSRPQQKQPTPSAETWSTANHVQSGVTMATSTEKTAVHVDSESAKWNDKSRAARAEIEQSTNVTKLKVGSQEWYKQQRANERKIVEDAEKELPEGWTAMLSHSHKDALYYTNIYSNATTWIRPTEPAEKQEINADADSHKCTVHVGGLDSFKYEHLLQDYEEELEEAFSQFGDVLQTQVRIRRRTEDDGSIKVSWALVTFLNASMAQSAVDHVGVLRREYPGVVTKLVDEKQAKDSKGAMGAVLEKAQAAEHEKLVSMMSSNDDEQQSQPARSTSSAVTFSD